MPRFPLLGEPGEWDVLTLMAATIFLEAEGEPDDGKVAVGWVIRTRADEWGLSIPVVVLGKDGSAYDDGHPFEVFSCWNDDYQIRARARLASAEGDEVDASWRAAAGALWKLLPDPVQGATHYLNVEVTKKIRKGTLPAWFKAESVLAVIGRHSFLRA